MRWWRRSESRFPADMLRRLETLGRYEFDPQGSTIDPGEVWEPIIAPLINDAAADREGFLADLQKVIAGDAGGFATYGAARLVWEVVGGPEALETPAAWPLIDAGIAFKKRRGLPTAAMTGYEMQRLGGW